MDQFRKNILVTGSTGMLGKDLVNELSSNSGYHVFGLSRHKLDVLNNSIDQIVIDLTDFDRLAEVLKMINPQIIVHCAANTDVESCEMNKKYTHDLHVETTKMVSTYKPNKVRLFYLSTDSVFDGKRGGYKEEDAVNPLNYYALSKHEGEQVVMEYNKNSVVLRTNIYGYHIPFKKSLVEWAIQSWRENKVVRGYGDVYFNPLYTKQLTRIIMRLLEENNLRGIVDIGCEQRISKYDFLVLLAREFGYTEDRILETMVENVNYLAKRPKNTTLDVTKIKNIIGNAPNLNAGIKELKNDLGNRKG